MEQNKSNIALLLGDPAGIGPELISKLLSEEKYELLIELQEIYDKIKKEYDNL